MLPLLILSSFSTKLTVVAVDNVGAELPFASIEYADKANSAKVEPLATTDFAANELKTFKIVRADNVSLETPAPASVKSISFRVSILDEEPVALEVLSTYRRPGLQATLYRARSVPGPVYRAPEQSGGIMGMLQRYWWIPMIFLLVQLCTGGGGRGAPTQQ
jgi:hypothetical protein